MSASARYQTRVGQVTVPDRLLRAVSELSGATGVNFAVTEHPVTGTQLHVVYANDHSLPERYSLDRGTFAFRVPATYPDAGPEDAFILATAIPLKLKEADPVRNSIDVNRTSAGTGLLAGTPIREQHTLVFSWHLWNRVAWDRNRHTLIDHYTHCIRRFEQPEHD